MQFPRYPLSYGRTVRVVALTLLFVLVFLMSRGLVFTLAEEYLWTR